ncbi:MAG TPA: hypothetical protein VIS96_12975 [Terrimicrobiaceae bacterium]
MKALLLVLFLPLVALGQEIKPFDRLGRDNVTIRAQHKSGGNSADYSYRASWGSYVRTVTSTKDIEVTVTQQRKEKHPLKLEFFFVIKGGPSRYAKKAGILDLPEGEGSAVFSTSSQQRQARWVYLGFREKSGERIEGWLVRALKDDRIIGIAGSSPSLEEMATDPEKLKSLLID